MSVNLENDFHLQTVVIRFKELKEKFQVLANGLLEQIEKGSNFGISIRSAEGQAERDTINLLILDQQVRGQFGIFLGGSNGVRGRVQFVPSENGDKSNDVWHEIYFDNQGNVYADAKDTSLMITVNDAFEIKGRMERDLLKHYLSLPKFYA